MPTTETKPPQPKNDFSAPDVSQELKKFSPTDAAIAEIAKEYLPLKVSSPTDAKGFDLVHAARMRVRSLRVGIEKRRVELKADALDYGRKVDSEAKRLTALLEPVESHLESQEKIVSDEKERILKAAVEAARLKKEAEEKALRDAEAARIQAERDKLAEERRKMEAEQKLRDEAAAEARRVEDARIEKERAALRAEQDRIAAEQAERQRVENIRLEKERSELKAQQDRDAERQRVEDERNAAERKRLAEIESKQAEERAVIEAEKKRIADEEAARVRKIELDRLQAEAAERARIETETRLKRELEEAAARKVEQDRLAEVEQKRIEAMRPDVEKIQAAGKWLQDFAIPNVTSTKAKETSVWATAAICEIAEKLESFKA